MRVFVFQFISVWWRLIWTKMWDSEEIRTFFLHRLLTHNQALGLSVCCHSQWQAALAHRVTFELFVAELHWAMPWAARFDLALLWVNQVTCRGPLKPKILVAVDQIDFLIIFFFAWIPCFFVVYNFRSITLINWRKHSLASAVLCSSFFYGLRSRVVGPYW